MSKRLRKEHYFSLSLLDANCFHRVMHSVLTVHSNIVSWVLCLFTNNHHLGFIHISCSYDR